MPTVPLNKNDNLPSFPIGILSVAILITISLLIWFSIYSFNTIRVLEKTISQDFKAIELRGTIMQLDEVLTMSARMSVITGDPKWEARYNHYDPILVNAIQEAGHLIPLTALGEVAKQTDTANQKLVDMERKAFDLAKQGKQAEAKNLLFGKEYETQKKIYAEGMNSYGKLLEERARYSLQSNTQQAYYSLLAVLISFIFLVVAWVLTYKAIRKWKLSFEKILKSEIKYKEEIENARDLLEIRVLERTADLKEKNIKLEEAELKTAALHNELIIAARRAGMADISTSVVHNIGNVLNSVNTSVSMLEEKIHGSDIKKIHQLTALIEQHQTNLASFIADDPQGQTFPKYLALLSKTWDNDQHYLLGEIEALKKNIHHIMNIISMQQSMSGVVSMIEEIHLPTLLEDALLLHKSACDKESIKIIRDFSFKKMVSVDKVKVLQIIVNLIKNSIDSLLESKNSKKELLLRIQEKDSSNVEIQVCDNGIGILPENLTKIFSYGFTTKKTGHGFGLHMSANAAKEMGGTLHGDSKGPGEGALFTLVLPQRFQPRGIVS